MHNDMFWTGFIGQELDAQRHSSTGSIHKVIDAQCHVSTGCLFARRKMYHGIFGLVLFVRSNICTMTCFDFYFYFFVVMTVRTRFYLPGDRWHV